MNTDQLKSLLRTVLKTAGSALATHGIMLSGAYQEMIFGIVVAVAPIVWDMLTHTQQAAIQKIAQIAEDPNSPVQALIMTADKKGQEAANAIPSNTVVAAGTNSAQEAAKS